MESLWSRSWRNCRKLACNCGEARVSARVRGLGGGEPTLLDLDVDRRTAPTGATTSRLLFGLFNRFFIWLRTPSWGRSFEWLAPILKRERVDPLLDSAPSSHSCHSRPRQAACLSPLVENQSCWGIVGTVWSGGQYQICKNISLLF